MRYKKKDIVSKYVVVDSWTGMYFHADSKREAREWSTNVQDDIDRPKGQPVWLFESKFLERIV